MTVFLMSQGFGIHNQQSTGYPTGNLNRQSVISLLKISDRLLKISPRHNKLDLDSINFFVCHNTNIRFERNTANILSGLLGSVLEPHFKHDILDTLYKSLEEYKRSQNVIIISSAFELQKFQRTNQALFGLGENLNDWVFPKVWSKEHGFIEI
jgi:hypothetical protein